MQVGKNATANWASVAFLVFVVLALSSQVSHGSHQSHRIGEANSPATSSTVLTKDQAIRIAIKFCNTVGAPATGQPTVLFPAPPRYTFQQDSYWLPRWRVTFEDCSEVDVVDKTGAVSSYLNMALMHHLNPNKDPGGPAISEAAAFLFADKVLGAAGLKEPVTAAAGNYSQLSSQPNTTAAIWYIAYRRMYKGISYHRDQQVIVQLQAQSGSVLTFNLTFPTPPPANGSATISSDQAIEVANAQIATSDVDAAVFKLCTQLVVQPNSWWLSPGPPKQQPGVSRVVWDCEYTAGLKRCHVWIDTETGKVIGGEVIQSK